MTTGWERLFAALGALSGAGGVALAAAAAHVAGPGSLDTAARFLLLHAPALLALAALLRAGLVGRRLGIASGILIASGLVLFCGDLSLRALLGVAPVRMAAPAGGALLILGWLLLAPAAAVAPGRG